MATERPNDPFGLSDSDFAVPGSDDNIIDTPQAQSMVKGINSENVGHSMELHNAPPPEMPEERADTAAGGSIYTDFMSSAPMQIPAGVYQAGL